MTIYAKTLNPEDFDYRVYEGAIDEDEDIIIDGGRDFCGVNNDVLKTINRLYDDYDTFDFESCLKRYYGGSIMRYFKDMLGIKNLTTKQAHEIKEGLEANKSSTYVACLSVIKGKPYEQFVLRGCCQGDVVYLYAPAIISQEYVDYIEAWYFGTGTEVEVSEEDANSPDEVEGWTFYTANWKAEDIKKEIKNHCGYKDEDDVVVVLWTYKSSYNIRHDTYELAN